MVDDVRIKEDFIDLIRSFQLFGQYFLRMNVCLILLITRYISATDVGCGMGESEKQLVHEGRQRPLRHRVPLFEILNGDLRMQGSG